MNNSDIQSSSQQSMNPNLAIDRAESRVKRGDATNIQDLGRIKEIVGGGWEACKSIGPVFLGIFASNVSKKRFDINLGKRIIKVVTRKEARFYASFAPSPSSFCHLAMNKSFQSQKITNCVRQFGNSFFFSILPKLTGFVAMYGTTKLLNSDEQITRNELHHKLNQEIEQLKEAGKDILYLQDLSTKEREEKISLKQNEIEELIAQLPSDEQPRFRLSLTEGLSQFEEQNKKFESEIDEALHKLESLPLFSADDKVELKKTAFLLVELIPPFALELALGRFPLAKQLLQKMKDLNIPQNFIDKIVTASIVVVVQEQAKKLSSPDVTDVEVEDTSHRLLNELGIGKNKEEVISKESKRGEVILSTMIGITSKFIGWAISNDNFGKIAKSTIEHGIKKSDYNDSIERKLPDLDRLHSNISEAIEPARQQLEELKGRVRTLGDVEQEFKYLNEIKTIVQERLSELTENKRAVAQRKARSNYFLFRWIQ